MCALHHMQQQGLWTGNFSGTYGLLPHLKPRCCCCCRPHCGRLQGLSIWIAHLETPAGTLASPFGNYTAVLPLGLTPLLPQLAPVVILPALVAAAAARLSLPPVLLLAASAGMCAGQVGVIFEAVPGSMHRVRRVPHGPCN